VNEKGERRWRHRKEYLMAMACVKPACEAQWTAVPHGREQLAESVDLKGLLPQVLSSYTHNG
jgi:hypothetical protein